MANVTSQNVLDANAKIGIGLVGFGRWCDTFTWSSVLQYGLEEKLPPYEVVAFADHSSFRRQTARDFLKAPACELYEDFRDLLHNPKVDAVVCNYEDFWHATVILDALAAGKHVLVAPPLCRYLPEAFVIWDACRKSGKILQVGVQGCADLKWHKAAEIIQTGALGPVVMAQGSYMRNVPKGEWNAPFLPWSGPKDLDWEHWKRQVAGAPGQYSPEDYFRWQKFYRYSSGLLSRQYPYKVYPYLLALGNPGFPLRVAAMGNHSVHTDAKTPGAQPREVPEFIQTIAELPGGAVMHMMASSVNEQGCPELIRGHHATLHMAGSSLSLKPEPAFADKIKPETYGPFTPEQVVNIFKNFLASIRGEEKPLCGIDLAIHAQVLLCMAEMSDRLKTTCLFNAATRTATDGMGRELHLPQT